MIDKALVAVVDPSLTLTVKFAVPAVVGEPENTPVAESDTPAGNEPADMAHV